MVKAFISYFLTIYKHPFMSNVSLNQFIRSQSEQLWLLPVILNQC